MGWRVIAAISGLDFAVPKASWIDGLSKRRPGRRPGWVRLGDLAVIKGLSAAGKSTAMAVFEDAGYFCADNLPPEMIRSLVELFQHAGSKVQSTVPVSDMRGGVDLDWLRSIADDLGASGARYVVFLDTDHRSFVNGDRETRRGRRIAGFPTFTDGVANELAALDPIRDRSDLVDAGARSTTTLPRRPADQLIPAGQIKPTVTFISFGHKHGPLRDADLVFDVSFLPNAAELKILANVVTLCNDLEVPPLRSFDADVIAYIDRDGRLDEFYERLVRLVNNLLSSAVREGKSSLVLGIGCSGGRHRSVVVAERLAAHFPTREYVVDVVHRDIDQWSRGWPKPAEVSL
jgi:RNase adapter protein RapZ